MCKSLSCKISKCSVVCVCACACVREIREFPDWPKDLTSAVITELAK
jgi:hypothetical protein